MAQTLTASAIINHLGLIPHPEGGYFLETHRSGSVPMTTKGQTDVSARTEFAVEKDEKTAVKISLIDGEGYKSLTVCPGRSSRRPGGDIRRNCLTSIYWMPTASSPNLLLSTSLSDHVHYYKGGATFEYTLYDPETRELSQVKLGLNVLAGEKPQVPVRGGVWKCGKLLDSSPDFCLIGEAVAPGFDFHDFRWVTPGEMEDIPRHVRDLLMPFVHQRIEELADQDSTILDATDHYRVRQSGVHN